MHAHRSSDYSSYFKETDYGPHAFRDGATKTHPFVNYPLRSQDTLDSSFGPLVDIGQESKHGTNYSWATGGKIYNQDNIKHIRFENKKRIDQTADEQNSAWAERTLKGFAEKDSDNQPFLLAVGFVRPHTPLIVPQKYFNQHPLNNITLPPGFLEGDRNDTFLHNFRNVSSSILPLLIRSYSSKEDAIKRYLQAYLASVTAVDDLIGPILDAIDKSHLKDNTIIVLLSDNGFITGQKEVIGKNVLWQDSTRVPLIIRAPGVTKAGIKNDHPVSLIDLFPTLLDLCNVTINTCIGLSGTQLEGFSLKPFLNGSLQDWRGPDTAFSIIPSQSDSHFAYSLRSKEFRYIYYDGERNDEELYDVSADPHEWTNLAGKSKYKTTLKSFRQQLKVFLSKSGTNGCQCNDFNSTFCSALTQSTTVQLKKAFCQKEEYLNKCQATCQSCCGDSSRNIYLGYHMIQNYYPRNRKPGCFDDPSFLFWSQGQQNSCQHIYRSEEKDSICKRSVVKTACPAACRSCCGDISGTFKMDGVETSCARISILDGACNSDITKSLCPLTCGQCKDDSTFCTDDPLAVVRYKGKNLDCPNIRKHKKKITICKDIGSARSFCPATCSLCCGDQTGTTLVNNIERNCNMANKSREIKKKYCKKKSFKSLCPRTCGKCCEDTSSSRLVDDTIMNCNEISQSMNVINHCKNSEIKRMCPFTCGKCYAEYSGFKYSIRCDDKIGIFKMDGVETSCARINILDGACDSEITKSLCPLTCGQCKDDSTFCTDDPLAVVRYKGKNLDCPNIRKHKKKITICKDIGSARSFCPATCSLCCGDQTGTTLVNNIERNCNMANKSREIKKKYCKKKSFKSLCPRTCGKCCEDTSSSRLVDDTIMNCNEISQSMNVINHCKNSEIKRMCPFTCGKCSGDYSGFKNVIPGKYTNCSNIASSANKDVFCSWPKIKKFCPATCRVCL